MENRQLSAPPHVLAARGPPLPVALPQRLPTQLTSFVGRGRELGRVRDLLTTTRLLTLTGAGGIGKTRLALEVVGTLAASYPDGVVLVELAALSNPALVPQAVALAVGVIEQAGRPLAQTLAGALRTRELLLVLDNCEQLLDACAALGDSLLRACPTLRILATSREALGVPGETAWAVPPLTLPPTETASHGSAERVSGSEAVRLFTSRAAAALPSFALTDRNAPAVAEICRGLDGVPLAIELAAARVNAFGLDEIAARLADSYRLLSSGSRMVAPRHQSLRAAIEWSYDALSAPEQHLFARLSVFAGGWTLEAAEVVAADLDTLNLLPRLVEKSLVLAEPGAGGDVRYRLLETLRRFGQERLVGRSETEAELVRQRHARGYLALAERAEPELVGADQGAWLDRLEAERDNVRAALDWLLGRGESETALRLGTSQWRFWERRGYFGEGRVWLERALADGPGAPSPLRAAGLHGAGHLAWRQRDLPRAGQLHAESLALARSLGDRAGEARSLYGLARVAASDGDFDTAQARAEESLAIHRALDSKNDVALSLNVLGEIARYRGLYDEARAHYEESLALFRQAGDMLGIQIELHNLGYVLKRQRDLRGAAEAFAESLDLSRDLGIRMGIASCIGGLAGVLAAQGEPTRAARLFGAAEALREAIAFPMEVVDRAELDADVETIHVGSGEVVHSTAWQAGRALPLEQAIEEALGVSPARPSPPRLSLLTARERQVAALVTRGLTNRQIADELVISRPTADRHVSNILGKLGLANRAQLAAWFVAQPD